MIDEADNAGEGSHYVEANPVPDIIADVLADTVVPGIPAPVRRNLLKAVGHLCTAAIEVPVAFLSGVAEERRAETVARIKLIDTTATQIAHQMETDPEYARLAVQKFGGRILREQVNLDMISKEAAIQLRDSSSSPDESIQEEVDNSISDDWLNAFEAEARLKSTEEMQVYFGKVLAGEIRTPGSFSTRTVRILAGLDQEIANHFARLCSMCISTLEGNVSVPSLGGNAGSNALREYGLSFATLNLLNEHGLIISDYNSWYEFVPCTDPLGTGQHVICEPLDFQDRHWSLKPKSKENVDKKLRINGVALTKSGKELSKIVQIEPMEFYSAKLVQYFERQGIRMVEVGDRRRRVVQFDTATGIDEQ